MVFWTSPSISIRQAKAFPQLIKRHSLKAPRPVILNILENAVLALKAVD